MWKKRRNYNIDRQGEDRIRMNEAINEFEFHPMSFHGFGCWQFISSKERYRKPNVLTSTSKADQMIDNTVLQSELVLSLAN